MFTAEILTRRLTVNTVSRTSVHPNVCGDWDEKISCCKGGLKHTTVKVFAGEKAIGSFVGVMI